MAEQEEPRATVAEAIAAWEAKGPTSLTVALVVDALYGVREVCDQVEANPIGWGGPPVVSLARTLQTRSSADTPSQATERLERIVNGPRAAYREWLEAEVRLARAAADRPALDAARGES